MALECGQKFFGENRVQEAFYRSQERIKINQDLELKIFHGGGLIRKLKDMLKMMVDGILILY